MSVRRQITEKDGIFSSTLHSSAKYYAMGEQGIYEVTNYACMADVDLTKARGQTSAELRGETLRRIKSLCTMRGDSANTDHYISYAFDHKISRVKSMVFALN